nr:MAG TPA: hypothetical protein [Caudoviricetes sp.]
MIQIVRIFIRKTEHFFIFIPKDHITIVQPV